MSPRLLSFAFILSAAVVGSDANAATVTVDFPSANSVYGGPDQTGLLGSSVNDSESHAGDSISETFSGTGLPAVNEAVFSVSFIDHTTRGTFANFDIFINGSQIGNVGWDSGGSGNTTHAFSDLDARFNTINADPSGNFTISIVSTLDVPPGQGSWDFLSGGSFELFGVEAAVPEQSTWAMMILGFAGIGFLAYRRKTAGLRIT